MAFNALFFLLYLQVLMTLQALPIPVPNLFNFCLKNYKCVEDNLIFKGKGYNVYVPKRLDFVIEIRMKNVPWISAAALMVGETTVDAGTRDGEDIVFLSHLTPFCNAGNAYSLLKINISDTMEDRNFDCCLKSILVLNFDWQIFFPSSFFYDENLVYKYGICTKRSSAIEKPASLELLEKKMTYESTDENLISIKTNHVFLKSIGTHEAFRKLVIAQYPKDNDTVFLTNPPCKDFVVKKSKTEEFLAVLRQFIPFFHENITAIEKAVEERDSKKKITETVQRLEELVNGIYASNSLPSDAWDNVQCIASG